MKFSRILPLLVCVACAGLHIGCSVIDVRAKIDPAGGALTDSDAVIYDFDRDGLWYLVFVHEEGLLAAVHRHNPGIHLFFDHSDIIFQCRCSGRGEVIDVMGQTFALKKGTVFLCDVENGNASVKQLPLPAPACDGSDPETVAKCVFEVSTKPEVFSFLSGEVRARLLAQWKIAENQKENSVQAAGPK